MALYLEGNNESIYEIVLVLLLWRLTMKSFVGNTKTQKLAKGKVIHGKIYLIVDVVFALKELTNL